ncbi:MULTISPECIES: hypothetical protein [unclassified Inquilinus]|uniref:hypothetical protein n=1 Tax=unclassified Inquilinus TaxID=2645927 RepID=UPI003F8EC61B
MTDITTASTSTHRRRRVPDFGIDNRGRQIATVTLANGAGKAVLDRADFDKLVTAGISINWSLAQTGTASNRQPAVKVNVGGRMVAVARLILNAPARSQVRYSGRDRTDLRRDNIRLADTMARGEGERETGIVNRSGWSAARYGQPKNAARAAERAHADALEAADRAEASVRVARWREWIAAEIAAGTPAEEADAEGREHSRAEAHVYRQTHGLDSQGRAPRPLAQARRGKGKGAKAPAPVLEPVKLGDVVAMALPF